MAWQEPKLDWAPEDGVRNDDFNRIEGNIAHLNDGLSAATSAILSESRYLYVATTGSDENGDGTQEKPFATIGKALSLVPADLNGYNAVIFVGAGTYNEPIEIDCKTNGTINIASNKNEAIILNGDISVTTCASVGFTGFSSITVNGYIHVDTVQSLYFQVDEVKVVDTIYATALSARASNITFTGVFRAKTLSYGSGIMAGINSTVYCESLIVESGTGTGVYADYGGQVSYGVTTNNATTKLRTGRGGRIYTGAQTSVPNY